MRKQTATSLVLGIALSGAAAHAASGAARHGLRPEVAQPNNQAPARSAQVPQAARQIEVFVLQGSNGPGGIAPGLEQLRLNRPPFSAFSQIALVSRVTLPLGTTPATVALPNGGSAAITSQGRLPNGRYGVTVQLNVSGRPSQIQFSATPGDPFFTTRSTGNNSALILAMVVRQ